MVKRIDLGSNNLCIGISCFVEVNFDGEKICGLVGCMNILPDSQKKLSFLFDAMDQTADVNAEAEELLKEKKRFRNPLDPISKYFYLLFIIYFQISLLTSTSSI